MDREDISHSAQKEEKGNSHCPLQRLLIGMLCISTFVFLAGGYWFYRHQELIASDPYYNELQAIARLQTSQILDWRHQHLANARMNSSGIVKALTLQWRETDQPEILQGIKERLQFFLENEGYHNMILADPTGRILVSLISKGAVLEPEEAALLKQVTSSAQPAFGDFYCCQNCQQIHLVVAAPILDANGQTAAVLLLMADPEQDLYPLIKSWSAASPNNPEAQLVRLDGKDVLFLNSTSNLPLPAMHYRLPLTATTTPYVQVALGRRGVFHGVDYDGKEIFAHLSDIPESNWFMVTKIDTRQMLAGSRSRGVSVLLLCLLGIATTGLLSLLINVSRKRSLSDTQLQIERQHNQSNKEIRATLYGIGDGVIATDASGQITRMNPEAERLSGCQEEVAIGQPLETIFQISDTNNSAQLELPIYRVLTHGVKLGVRSRFILNSLEGQQWPVTVSWSPIQDESNTIIGAVLVLRDQTQRMAMEKEREESTRRYSELVENLNDFIWETDTDCRYSFASRRSLDLLGYTPEEFIGKKWIDILDNKVESKGTTQKFKEIIANHHPYSHLRRAFIRKDGSSVVLESSATPIFDPLWRFRGYRGISRDVTELKKAEELKEQLQQAQKMQSLGTLAGGIAHDFNNILSAILGYTEQAQVEAEEIPAVKKYLKEVYSAGQRAADLVRQILIFSRQKRAKLQPLQVPLVAREVIQLIKATLSPTIELKTSFSKEVNPVLADPTQVHQIIMNLCTNASHAMESDGGVLSVTIDQVTPPTEFFDQYPHLSPGPYLRLQVSDTGCGMTPDIMASIFEPYFTTKDIGEGTGLGLAVTQGIVKDYGGKILVESFLGQGTTFTVLLPTTDSTFVGVQTEKEIQELKGSECILLVEDEEVLCSLYQSFLEQAGYVVIAVNDPYRAFDLFKNNPAAFDLVLSDVAMPRITGDRLGVQMMAVRPDLPVVLMTGFSQHMTEEVAKEQGFRGVLFKPLMKNHLLVKLRAILTDSNNLTGPGGDHERIAY